MNDNKGSETESLDDILGPELTAKLATPKAGAAPRPAATGGAPRPPVVSGAPLPPAGPGKLAGSFGAPPPRVSPPPPPGTASSSGSGSVPIPRPQTSASGAPRPPGSPALGSSSFAAPRPPGSGTGPAAVPLPAKPVSAPVPTPAAKPFASAAPNPFLASPVPTTPLMPVAAPPRAPGQPLGQGTAITAEIKLPPIDFSVAFGESPVAPTVITPPPTQEGASSPPTVDNALPQNASAADVALPMPPEANAAPPGFGDPSSATSSADRAAADPPLPSAHGGPAVPEAPFEVASSTDAADAAGVDVEFEHARSTAPTLAAYWRGLSPVHRALHVGLPLIAAVLLVVISLRVGRAPPPAPVAPAASPNWRGFVTSTEQLASGPDASFAAAGAIEKGEAVERLDTVRDFALVRDSSGRVGYVRNSVLAATAPPVTPETPFTRCQRRPLEADIGACEQRGREQLEACRAGCKTEDCGTQCGTRLADCRLTCTQPVAPMMTAATPGATGTAAVAAQPGMATPSVIPVENAVSADDGKGKKAKGKKAKMPVKRKGKRKNLPP